MFRFLLLAFIVVPIAELYLIIQVGSAIGGWETVGLLILDSVIGAWLVRREGFSILAKVQGSLAAGELPTNSLIDGLLVLVAGALMLTPGFLTDGLGLVLLLPPTRAIVRTALKKRFSGRVAVHGGAWTAGPGGWTDATAHDVDFHDVDGNGVAGNGHDEHGHDEPPGAIELGPATD